MPFDREDALKKAEKFLRLGRLDAAIAEYQRVVDEIPNDWKTLNALGDLYLRANQPARATSLFARIADHLAAEGFDARAQAFYKRILKVTPDDERALEALAGLAIRQGILVEAKGHLVALSRRQAGARGCARRGRSAAARQHCRPDRFLGATGGGAVSRCQSGNTDLAAQRALGDRRRSRCRRQPPRRRSTCCRKRWRSSRTTQRYANDCSRAPIGAKLFEPLRASLTTAADCLALADRLTAAGWPEGAALALDEAVRLSPESRRPGRAPRARRASTAIAPAALDHLSAIETGGRSRMCRRWRSTALCEPDAARRRCSGWERLLDQGRISDQDVAVLIRRICGLGPRHHLAGARTVCRPPRRNAGTQREAVRQLRGFCDTHPGHIAALMKLVEMLVDVGSEDELIDAQARLAEAYLQVGLRRRGADHRRGLGVAVAGRHARRDLLRRALALAGEPDPENAVTEFAGQASGAFNGARPGISEDASGVAGERAGQRGRRRARPVRAQLGRHRSQRYSGGQWRQATPDRAGATTRLRRST